MNRSRALALLFFTATALLLGGCVTNPDVESTRETAVPWGRPADWEGTIPGMSR